MKAIANPKDVEFAKTEETVEKVEHGSTVDQSLARWTAMCDWLTQSLKGIETTIERHDRSGEVIQCFSRPLVNVTPRIAANEVLEIAVCVRIDGHRRVFEVPGPHSLRLQWNSAGLPTVAELGYQEGKLILKMTQPDESH